MNFTTVKKMGIALVLSVFLLACFSVRKNMDSWMGSTKQNLILQKGPPEKIASDGADGEVLIYSAQTYNPYTGQVFYNCVFYYAHANGILYHWMTKSSPVPPQQMNVNLYLH